MLEINVLATFYYVKLETQNYKFIDVSWFGHFIEDGEIFITSAKFLDQCWG